MAKILYDLVTDTTQWKRCYENEQNNLNFETFLVLYIKLYYKKQVGKTKLPSTHLFFVKISRISLQIGNMNLLVHNQYMKTNKLIAKLLHGI